MKRIYPYLILVCLPLWISCHRPWSDTDKIMADIARIHRATRIQDFVSVYEKIVAQEISGAGSPGAAIAIVADSTYTWMKGYGVRSVRSGEEVDAHTLFRLGSLSKGISAVLVSKLVHQGKLSWNDHVCDYIRSFTMADTNQAHRISIAHLLSHSTGLPRHTFTNLIEDGLAPAELVNRLTQVPLIGKEGSSFAYQNFAFSLVEDIVRAKTSQTFCELLRSEIFSPASMSDASTTMEDFLASGNYAHPHRPAGVNSYVEIPLNGKYYNAVSAGGINASIFDMSQWLEVIMGLHHQVIDEAVLQDVFQPRVETSAEGRFRNWKGMQKTYYGLGWRIMEYPDRQVFYHGGSVNDYRTEIAIDPQSHVGICVLFNSHNPYASRVIPQFLELYHAAFGAHQD